MSAFSRPLVWALYSLASIAANGAQLASDSFVYATGSINGNAGGTGFNGTWEEVAGDMTNPLVIDSASLSYPGITSAGGSVKLPQFTTYSDSQRPLSTSYGDGVYYFSFLGQSIADAGLYIGLGLGDDLALAQDNYTVYLEYNQIRRVTTFSIKREFDGGQSGFYELPGTGTFFVVGRLTLASGADTMDVWVNPLFGATPPTTPNVSLTGYDIGKLSQVFLDGGGSSSQMAFAHLDEFKLGEQYSDVVPVPEPSSCVAVLCSSAYLALLARRSFRSSSL